MIRPARQPELPRLISLWRTCFGDSEEEIRRCFRSFCPPGQALVLEEQGEIRSMLLRLPVTVALADGTVSSADYVYAFCTDPAEQGKGYGRSLLAAEEELARADGSVAVFMVPGEQSLFRFYAALGYQPSLLCREETMTGSPSALTVTPCSPERYQREREFWLAGRNHVRYGAELLTYQAESCRLSGGGLYDLGCGVASAAAEGETLLVQELLTCRPEEAVSALLAALGRREAKVRFPASPGEGGRPFGVVKWLREVPTVWDSGWLAFGFE